MSHFIFKKRKNLSRSHNFVQNRRQPDLRFSIRFVRETLRYCVFQYCLLCTSEQITLRHQNLCFSYELALRGTSNLSMDCVCEGLQLQKRACPSRPTWCTRSSYLDDMYGCVMCFQIEGWGTSLREFYVCWTTELHHYSPLQITSGHCRPLQRPLHTTADHFSRHFTPLLPTSDHSRPLLDLILTLPYIDFAINT